MALVLESHGLGKAYPMKPSPGAHFRAQLLGRSQIKQDDFWAVRNVSFNLDRGESVGIIGRNGSGKSTLLQLICGIMEPSEGRVAAYGRIASLLELGAGFDPEFSGRENVFLNAALLGLSQSETEQKFDQIADFAEIGRFLDEPVKTYSSGMFVRLAFAVASHVEPDILIVDEALSVGDARFSAKCIKHIRALRASGCTLLFVSHDVGIVRTLCDRAIWLDSGRVEAMGDVFSVTSRYMERMFEDVDIPPDMAGRGSSEEVVLPTASGASPVLTEVDDAAPRPINHWGSHPGAIKRWSFESAAGAALKVVEYGDSIRVRVRFACPEGFDAAHLALSLSIKDLKGTDLLVLSSHDENAGLFAGRQGEVEVSFDFVNRLTEGKYLLVLALEDRAVEAIQYFEYIEGASYFSVTSRSRRFGLFNVPATVTLT